MFLVQLHLNHISEALEHVNMGVVLDQRPPSDSISEPGWTTKSKFVCQNFVELCKFHDPKTEQRGIQVEHNRSFATRSVTNFRHPIFWRAKYAKDRKFAK